MFLLKDFYERVPRFSKQYKYLLGEKIIDCIIRMIMNIVSANGERVDHKRIIFIESILSNIEELFIYIRIAEELKQFKSATAYPFLIEKLMDISRQSSGWKKIYIPRNS